MVVEPHLIQHEQVSAVSDVLLVSVRPEPHQTYNNNWRITQSVITCGIRTHNTWHRKKWRDDRLKRLDMTTHTLIT